MGDGGKELKTMRLGTRALERRDSIKEQYSLGSGTAAVEQSIKIAFAVSEYVDERNMLQVISPDGEKIKIVLG